MGDLFFNKIAGVIIGAVLVVLVITELGHMLVPSHAAHELTAENTAYPVDWAAIHAGGSATETAIVEEGPTDYGLLLASADLGAGERAIRACISCHTFDNGGASGTGPNLWDVVGRGVASVGGFGYSSALEARGGEWDYAALDAFLENPRGDVDGTAMSYRGVRNDEQRIALIAYLRSLSDSPAPLPAPLTDAAAVMDDASDDIMEAATDAATEMVEDAVAETPVETEAPAEDDGN
jgi:cytochrome c